MSDRKKIRTRLIIEGLIAFIIAISPILFYFYKYIPKSEETWQFLYIDFSENGYRDVSTAFYYYLAKLVPLGLLVIWFSTCNRWWYHVILIPIAMYSFQLYSVVSEDIKKIDENEIMYLLGVCMIVIPIVYFIRIKLVDKYVHGIDLEAMEAELKELKQKEADEQAKKLSKEITKKGKNYVPTEPSDEIVEHLATEGFGSKLKKVQGHLSDWISFKS